MAVELPATKTETLVTGEGLLAMGNIGPCELIEGRIVYMSPTGFPHGRYEIKFGLHLENYALKTKSGKVMVGEVGIYVRRDPDTVRAADVVYISNDQLAKQAKKEGFLEVAPEIVVEILSPDDRWQDVTQKMREYFGVGVRLIWVADPAHKIIYSYRSMTTVKEFAEADMLTAEDVLPDFAVPVSTFFEE